MRSWRTTCGASNAPTAFGSSIRRGTDRQAPAASVGLLRPWHHEGVSDDADQQPDVYIVLDALDVDRVAEFWTEALRYRRVDRVEQYVVLVLHEGNAGSVFL